MNPSAHPLDAALALRERWRSRRPTYGAWLHTRDPFGAEIVARAGFDWVCIDMQHGTARAGDLVCLLQALGVAGKAVVVRVPWNEPGVIMNVLDAGASGVIVPMVDSPAEAAHAVAACRYPPLGSRSWGPVRAALGAPDYSSSWANERVLCIVMVETPHAIEQVGAILAVPGVDAVFIGPADLALSFGVDRHDPVNAGHIGAIKAACDGCGVPAGIATRTLEEAGQAAADGFAMIAIPSDAVLLADACASFLAAVREDG
jgi:4-hydroxy-2-oxoheptanedioate aldolase